MLSDEAHTGTSPEGYDTTMFSQAIDYASLPFTSYFRYFYQLRVFKLEKTDYENQNYINPVALYVSFAWLWRMP